MEVKKKKRRTMTSSKISILKLKSNKTLFPYVNIDLCVATAAQFEILAI